MQPRFLTGDLVLRRNSYVAYPGRKGIIVGVIKSNEAINHLTELYPWVYYIFFDNGQLSGPLFDSEINVA